MLFSLASKIIIISRSFGYNIILYIQNYKSSICPSLGMWSFFLVIEYVNIEIVVRKYVSQKASMKKPLIMHSAMPITISTSMARKNIRLRQYRPIRPSRSNTNVIVPSIIEKKKLNSVA